MVHTGTPDVAPRSRARRVDTAPAISSLHLDCPSEAPPSGADPDAAGRVQRLTLTVKSRATDLSPRHGRRGAAPFPETKER